MPQPISDLLIMNSEKKRTQFDDYECRRGGWDTYLVYCTNAGQAKQQTNGIESLKIFELCLAIPLIIAMAPIRARNRRDNQLDREIERAGLTVTLYKY